MPIIEEARFPRSRRSAPPQHQQGQRHNATIGLFPGLRLGGAQFRLDRARYGRYKGNGHNSNDHQLEMLLHHRDAAEEVAQQHEDCGPRNTADDVEQQEFAVVHVPETCKERHERADEREETTQEDRQRAVLVNKAFGFLDALGRHRLDAPGIDDVLAEFATDPIVARIAQDRRHPHHRKQQRQVQAAAIGREQTRREQERITGQKRHDNHAGLDEDDQEDGDVRAHAERGNPFGNEAARVLQQVNEELDDLLEDESIFWNDDIEIVQSFVLKTIKQFNKTAGEDFILLPMFNDDEDRDYATTLLRETLANGQKYREMIAKNADNWDFERIAFMDVVIMQVAVAELYKFENIPIRVTLNEYIDLAKSYSTPKSSTFINGVLDAIVTEMKKDKTIFKN